MASLSSILDPLVAAAAVGMALAERGRIRELSQPVHNARGMLAQLPSARRSRTAQALAQAVSRAEADVERWLVTAGRSDADLRAGAAALEAWMARDDATTDRFADRLRDEDAIAQETVACLAAANPDVGSSDRTRESAEVIVAAAISAARGSSHAFTDLVDFADVSEAGPRLSPSVASQGRSGRPGERARLQAAIAEASTSLDALANGGAAPAKPTPRPRGKLDNLPAIRTTPSYLNGATDMAKLHDALNYQPGKTAAIVGASGRDGVGCSSLALAYCDRYRKAYHRVWWVRAGSRATMLSDLADLATAIDPESARGLGLPDQAALGVDLASRRVGDTSTLLVFDDAPAPEEIRSWTPRGGARVLVVSRADGWTKHIPSIVLGMMSPGVARKLTQTVSRREFDAGLRAITGTLQDLPLALMLSGRFLRESPKLSSAAYASLYAEAAQNTNGDIDSRTAATVVTVTLDHITKRAPTAKAVMRLAACFGETDLPFGLIGAAAPHLPREVLRERSGVREALRELHRHGLVHVNDAGAEPTLSFHSAVRRVLRADLHRDPKASIWVKAAFKGANRTLAEADTARGRRLAPHMFELLAHTADIADDSTLDQLKLVLAERLADDGDHAAAEPLFRGLTARSPSAEAVSDIMMRRRLAGLAKSCAALGLPREAERLARRAFLLTDSEPEEEQDTSHEDVVGLLADLVMASGRFAEAEPWVRRSMEMQDRKDTPAQERIANRRHLARICLWTDQRDEAETLLEQALDIAEKEFEPRHIAVASALCAVANLRLANGWAQECIDLMSRATDICMWRNGLNHPATRQCAEALVQLHYSFGDELDARVCAGRYGISDDIFRNSLSDDRMMAPFSHIEARAASRPDHLA